MKLQHIRKSVRDDMLTIMAHYQLSMSDPSIDHGDGLKLMYVLLAKLCRDRAYDDTHPHYVSGEWTRILPCDGRDYCFMYLDADGNKTCDDTHVKTLLKAIKKDL